MLDAHVREDERGGPGIIKALLQSWLPMVRTVRLGSPESSVPFP